MAPEYGCTAMTVGGRTHGKLIDLVRDIESSLEISRARRETWGPPPNRRDFKPGTGRGCFGCGREGHKRADCPETNAKGEQGSRPWAGSQPGRAVEGDRKPERTPENWRKPPVDGSRGLPEAAKPKEETATGTRPKDREPLTCHRCKKPGHFIKDCKAVLCLNETVGDENFFSFDGSGTMGQKEVQVNGREWMAKLDFLSTSYLESIPFEIFHGINCRVFLHQESSTRILKCDRTTSVLISHLWKKHRIDKDSR